MSDEKGGATATAGAHYAPKYSAAGCGAWGIVGFASSKNVTKNVALTVSHFEII